METYKEKLSIGEAAKLMRVSLDTLRRWDKSGRFQAGRTRGGHRQYLRQDIELYRKDLFALANAWTSDANFSILQDFYCAYSSVFQARLIRMQTDLLQDRNLESMVPLLVAIAGEVGNNSFDHNIGNWPDIPGVFFGYDANKKHIVLADRGVGVLATLRRVRPDISSHQEALRVAFTEIISGRDPEKRGNGLKFVRQVIARYPIHLLFQSGDAILRMTGGSPNLKLETTASKLRGCLACITYDYLSEKIR